MNEATVMSHSPETAWGETPSDKPLVEGIMPHKTILVVEDNSLLLEFVHDLLDTNGYEILSASNTQEALNYLEDQHQPIDLIFSDIRIPGGMDGITLARKAKALRKNVKILLTTGFAQEILGKAVEEEFQILQKPYAPKSLTQRIQVMLETP